MKFLLLVLAFTALLWLFPHIRIFFKRLSLCRRLTAACKKHGWTLSPTHRFWYFGRKNDVRCDVHIVTKHDVFSVKLMAIPYRRSALVFTGGSGYFIRGYLGLLGNTAVMARIPLDGPRQLLPHYRFREGFDAAWETRSHHKILLLSPTSFEILRMTQNGKREVLGTGDLVLDMNVYSLSRLLGRIEQLDGHMHGDNPFQNVTV